MPSRIKYNAVITTGKYRDSNGTEKKRYHRVGVVFENDHGQLSLKLDSMPCQPDWSGYIQFFDANDDRQQQRPQAPAQPQPEPRRSTGVYAETGDVGEGDDILF